MISPVISQYINCNQPWYYMSSDNTSPVIITSTSPVSLFKSNILDPFNPNDVIIVSQTFLGKSALQIYFVIISVSRHVCVCVCVCARARACVRAWVCVCALLHKPMVPGSQQSEDIWNRTISIEWRKSRFSPLWPWHSFWRSNFWHLICVENMKISRKLWETEQPLLLPSYRKSGICHRMVLLLTWETEQPLLLPSDRKSGICHRMVLLLMLETEQPLLLPSDRKSGICHRMVLLLMLTYIFKVTNFEMCLSRKRWGRKKCFRTTFIEVNIYHRMWPLWMWYCMTLTYIFQVKLFKWLF